MRFRTFTRRIILPTAFAAAVMLTVPGLLMAQGKGGGGGKNNASLSVSVTPNSFSESDAGAVGTVTRENSDTSVALTVTLASSNSDQATVLGVADRVPPSVDILPGEVSAEFQVVPVNDTLIDGDQSVTISVSAADHSGASASITVVDDEGLPSIEYQGVTISLPAWDPIPPEDYEDRLNDFNDSGQACGRYGEGRNVGPTHGWIYSPVLANHPGDKAIDVNTLKIVGLNEGWVISNCIGISNNGLVVGTVSPVDDPSDSAWRGYVLDISVSPAQFYELPDNKYGWNLTYPKRVNDNGDIAGWFSETVDSVTTSGSYLFNPGLRSGDPDTELEILDFVSGGLPVLNNPPEGFAPTIAGVEYVSDTRRVVVYTRGSTPYNLPPEASVDPALNDFGGVAARGAIEVPINKKQSESVQVVYRDYVTKETFEGYYGIVKNLNNAGTIMMRASQSLTLYHDDYGFLDVASMTSQNEFPEWTTQAWMNNYRTDGFGQIAVKGSTDGEFQILTPVDLTP